MAANPNGRMIPAAIVAVKGVRFGHDAMYGFGGGPEEAPAVMVRVVLALAPAAGVIELGANWNVAPVGNPETVNVTAEAKPFEGITLTCTVDDAPCFTVKADCARLMVKSPAGAGATGVMAPNRPPFSPLTPAEKYSVFGSPVPLTPNRSCQRASF